LDTYPKADRPIEQRGREITPAVRAVARQYGREFFDGDRLYGYGGYRYDGRWAPIAKRLREHYALPDDAAILDVGCAKGFLLYDFMRLMPAATVAGIDISTYAVEHAKDEVRPHLAVGSADALPYADDSFDLVLSINTVHNLPGERCAAALRQIERVKKQGGHAFVTVDAWRNDAERDRLMKWMLTAYTYMSTADWERFFAEAGYRGDYYWFIA
jgi:ubiquinone/menaquinone biosynthesis C-methylase UbiE